MLVHPDVVAGGHVGEAGHAVCGGVLSGRAGGGELFVESLFRNGPFNQPLGRVFENTGRLSGLRIAHDHAAGRVLGLPGHACEFERQAVGQGHVAIEAIHKDRMIGRRRIDQFSGWQRRARPSFVVPIAAENPPAFRHLLHIVAQALGHLVGRFRVAQVHV